MKVFVASMMLTLGTMSSVNDFSEEETYRVLKGAPVPIFNQADYSTYKPDLTDAAEGLFSLSTRTMQNGLSKATRLVGCSLESGYSSLPGVTGGGGYRS